MKSVPTLAVVVALLAFGFFALARLTRSTPTEQRMDDLPGWVELPIPATGTAEFDRLKHGLGWSRQDWRVTVRNGRVVPREDSERPFFGPRPDFPLDVDEVDLIHRTPVAAEPVRDGWLVAYNRGEWGGAVWWFSRDGRERREASRHQVNQFVRWSGEVYAVEGLDHGLPRGRVVRFGEREGGWQADDFATLPGCGYVVAVGADGRLVVGTHAGLMAVSTDKAVSPLAASQGLFWFPNSIQVTPDGRVYVGLRGAVAVYDPRTAQVRLFAPSAELPAADR